MARTKANKAYNTFVRGIITEANPLEFPVDATVNEENFQLNRDGSRQRRLGMDFETGYDESGSVTLSTFQDSVTGSWLWRAPANSGTFHFAVVQVASTLYFYDANTTAISANEKSFTVDLTTYETTHPALARDNLCDVTVANGALYVANPACEPLRITYDEATDSITVTSQTLKIRDFAGIDDGLDVDANPSTLSDEHNYNLLNQGWDSTKITSYQSGQGSYPSNAQVWWYGKDATSLFDDAELVKQYFGNTRAPNGHYILDAFNKDRTTVSGIAGLTTVTDKGRPSTVANYAGRVCWAGVESTVTNDEKNTGNVYFSQVLEGSTQWYKCYQDADPTSEIVSDLVDTDGGVIPIPESGKILRIVPLDQVLFVFAENGVWMIMGTTEQGFIATNYQVRLLSRTGCIGARTIVPLEGSVLYWAEAGIMLISPDERTGRMQISNLSERSIQDIYTAYSGAAKTHAVGTYDPVQKRVRWLVNDTASFDGASYQQSYNTELILDTVLNAFYKYRIYDKVTESPYVAGLLPLPATVYADGDYAVTSGGVTVTSGGTTVTVTAQTATNSPTRTKYLIVRPSGSDAYWSFGQYNNTDFEDWSNVDAFGFFITGHETLKDIMRRKDAIYLVMFFKRTENAYEYDDNLNLVFDNPSSLMVQGQWEWTDDVDAGRWTTARQMYRLKRHYIPPALPGAFDYGFDVIKTKNRLRGHGSALSLYGYTEAGKDCHVLGWALSYGGSQTV